MRTNKRGFAPAVLVVALGLAAAAAIVPNWRPWNWAIFQKKVPVAALEQAQADLARAKAEAEQRQAVLEAAIARQKQDMGNQVAYAHEMTAGASIALVLAPQTAEVTLAKGLLDRAEASLTAAIGDLPAERQAEIRSIVAGALSAKQAEIDAAKAALQARDSDLARISADREKIQSQIPVLQRAVQDANSQVVSSQTVVSQKTQEVVTYAEKVAAKEREAGSLSAQIASLFRIALFVGIIYLLIHVVLPSLAQEFPALGWLTTLNKVTKSLTSAHT